MDNVLGTAYRLVFRRASTTVAFVAVGAIFTEALTHGFSDGLYALLNRGKRWQDVKHKYVTEE